MCKNREKMEYSINEYLFNKMNLYKSKNIEIETLLREKEDYIDEIQQREMILNKEEKLHNFADLFTPYQNLDNNNGEMEKYIKIKNILKEECNNLEVEIKKNNQEIEEISCILTAMSECKSKMDNNNDNFIGNYNILKSQEYENQRISRDLHDSVVQSLTSYIHKIELIQKLIDIDASRCRLELELLRVNIKSSINELRDIIYNLRPMSFDDIGMSVTLDNIVNQIRFNNDVNIIYKIDENSMVTLNDVDPIISISLLRIVQEACSNSIRHGGAKTIKLNIIVNDSDIQMNIIDDGKGFDLKTIYNLDRSKNCSYGISIMRERVLLLQGSIDIDSKINKGTKIEIKVPIQHKGE